MIGQAGGMDLLSSESDPSVKLVRQVLEQAQAQLGPAAFQAAWADGQQLTVEQVLALLTEDLGADALPRSSLD